MDRKWGEKDTEKRSDGTCFVWVCWILRRGLNADLSNRGQHILSNRGQHISQIWYQTSSLLTLTKRTHAPTDSQSRES